MHKRFSVSKTNNSEVHSKVVPGLYGLSFPGNTFFFFSFNILHETHVAPIQIQCYKVHLSIQTNLRKVKRVQLNPVINELNRWVIMQLLDNFDSFSDSNSNNGLNVGLTLLIIKWKTLNQTHPKIKWSTSMSMFGNLFFGSKRFIFPSHKPQEKTSYT